MVYMWYHCLKECLCLKVMTGTLILMNVLSSEQSIIMGKNLNTCRMHKRIEVTEAGY